MQGQAKQLRRIRYKGVGIKVRVPRNCDECKHCDVFQGEYYEGYCLQLKVMVNIESEYRDRRCPIQKIQDRGYLVRQAEMPLACCMLKAVENRIVEVNCPFGEICKRYDPKYKWRRPDDCGIIEIK